MEKQKICKDCENFLGGGDWNLCCKEKHEGYPFGFLCYEDTPACEKFKPKETAIIKEQTSEIIKIFNESSIEDKLEISKAVDNLSKVINDYIETNMYRCSSCWKHFYIGEAEEKFETWIERDTSISSDFGKPIEKSGYRYYCPHCKNILPTHYGNELRRKQLGIY